MKIIYNLIIFTDIRLIIYYFCVIYSIKKKGDVHMSYKNKICRSEDVSGFFKNREVGKIQLMCPNCFHLYPVEVDNDIQILVKRVYSNDLSENESEISIGIDPFAIISYSTYKCAECGDKHFDVKLIPLDYNIAPTISILNKKGYYTMFCCESHEGEPTAYIYFSDIFIMDEVIRVEKYKLPDTWYIDEEDYNDGMFIIRSKRTFYPDNIRDIELWATSLPDIKY